MGQTFSEPVTEKESSIQSDETFMVASSSIQGWRISKLTFEKFELEDNQSTNIDFVGMEDAHTILLSMPDDPSAAFFGVYDGHGGAKVASYASEHLYKSVTSHELYLEGKIEEALKAVFVEFDEMMFNDEKMRDELAGSTAVVIMIKNNLIYCVS